MGESKQGVDGVEARRVGDGDRCSGLVVGVGDGAGGAWASSTLARAPDKSNRLCQSLTQYVDAPSPLRATEMTHRDEWSPVSRYNASFVVVVVNSVIGRVLQEDVKS